MHVFGHVLLFKKLTIRGTGCFFDQYTRRSAHNSSSWHGNAPARQICGRCSYYELGSQVIAHPTHKKNACTDLSARHSRKSLCHKQTITHTSALPHKRTYNHKPFVSLNLSLQLSPPISLSLHLSLVPLPSFSMSSAVVLTLCPWCTRARASSLSFTHTLSSARRTLLTHSLSPISSLALFISRTYTSSSARRTQR